MLIDVKNLFKIYHEGEESEVRALDGVSLSVDRGEFLAIIGQSGCKQKKFCRSFEAVSARML